MLLKNYWLWYEKLCCVSVATSSYGSGTTITGALNTSGATVAMENSSYSNHASAGVYNRNPSEIALVVGTGTQAVDASDYTLETDITSSLSGVTQAVTKTGTSSEMLISVTITGSNQTGNSVTITELGVVKPYYTISGSSSAPTTKANMLIVREIIDTPITVADGEAFSITYVWKQQ